MTQQVLSSAGAIKESNSFGNAGYGTVLPTSPTDGMEYILVDSVSLPTYQWRMRWNNGSANTDKWEFVGGAPFSHEILTGEASNSATYADLTTVGPTFTMPRAGVYMVTFGAFTYNSSAASPINAIAVKIGAAAAVDADNVQYDIYAVANRGNTLSRTMRRTFAASDVCKLVYKNSANTATFSNRSMHITPVRVS